MARWAFLWFASNDVAEQYCRPGGRDQLYVPGRFEDVDFFEADVIAEHFDCFKEQGISEAHGVSTSWVELVTCNPQTLRPRKAKKNSRAFSKAEAFEAQFAKRGTFMIGYQEARNRRECISKQGEYLTASSACRKNGSGGCACAS